MPDSPSDPLLQALRPRPTGNVLVAFKPDLELTRAAELMQRMGVSVRSSQALPGTAPTPGGPAEFHATAISPLVAEGQAVMFDRLNVAVIPARQGAASAMAIALAQDDNVLLARPEFYMFAISDHAIRYDQWVREGLRLLIDAPDLNALPLRRSPGAGALVTGFADTAESTWGMKATGCDKSSLTGRGIRLAVLDTGFDLGFAVPAALEEPFDSARRHPDFQGRQFVLRNFVDSAADELVTDRFGHGTHCVGTAAGPLASPNHPRYGVATGATIYIGKVLNDQGSGRESDIIAGIDWAIGERCKVISMSLGRPAQSDEEPDPLYEQIGEKALDANCLILAAAGNDSHRPSGFIAPVGAPANSRSIMAVAAVDASMQVAQFSNGGINAEGGEINLAGPGVGIFSSFPRPELYKRLMGTSMATPHAAGIAALWAESDPELGGRALWRALERAATEIGLSKRDIGAGLVQAPRGGPATS